jgi:hypothetical protein
MLAEERESALKGLAAAREGVKSLGDRREMGEAVSLDEYQALQGEVERLREVARRVKRLQDAIGSYKSANRSLREKAVRARKAERRARKALESTRLEARGRIRKLQRQVRGLRSALGHAVTARNLLLALLIGLGSVGALMALEILAG